MKKLRSDVCLHPHMSLVGCVQSQIRDLVAAGLFSDRVVYDIRNDIKFQLREMKFEC